LQKGLREIARPATKSILTRGRTTRKRSNWGREREKVAGTGKTRSEKKVKNKSGGQGQTRRVNPGFVAVTQKMPAAPKTLACSISQVGVGDGVSNTEQPWPGYAIPGKPGYGGAPPGKKGKKNSITPPNKTMTFNGGGNAEGVWRLDVSSEAFPSGLRG